MISSDEKKEILEAISDVLYMMNGADTDFRNAIADCIRDDDEMGIQSMIDDIDFEN